MKKLTAILFLSFYLFHAADADPGNTCMKAGILLKLFEKYHYQPFIADDKVSTEIFNDLIRNLDPKGLYFTNADIATLTPYRPQLLKQVSSGSCTLLDALTKLYRKKLVLADTLISQLSVKPFDYTTNELYDYNGTKIENVKYAENDGELRNKWAALLKYEVLHSLLLPTAEKKDMLTLDNATLLKKQAEHQSKIRTVEKRKIHRILDAQEGFDNYVGSLFINTIANRFDPHSLFFTPSEKEDFMAQISKDGLSFGFYLDENKNGEIEISHIVPGGNAWKSNQINIGDVLLKVKFDNNNPLDLLNVDMEEFEEMAASNKISKLMEVTVRKANGQVKTALLHKEKTEQEENIVKSYILNGAKKIGYISLPSFYDEWGNKNPLGCGNDVAKEIVKLQQEKIDGLILDLRYNGGGSLHEALNLAGIFINEGPLCVVKGRNEKPVTLKDMNRGTAYDGPLLVMVNGYSASASELLSAVLQDYNRAVIVGNTTFGKATVQEPFPLDVNYDPQYPNAYSKSDLGYVNITTEKFYRVTTFSHQKKGVQPDIFLPDFSFFSQKKEANEKYALSSDTVIKNVYYTPLPDLPKAALSEKSGQRVKASSFFKNLLALNDSLKILEAKTAMVPLNLDQYKAMKKNYASLENSIDTLMAAKSTSYTVANNSGDIKVFNVNDFSKQMNDDYLKKIQSDLYLDEAFNIITDLINSK